MRELLVDLAYHKGIVLQQCSYKALICMDYGADEGYFFKNKEKKGVTNKNRGLSTYKQLKNPVMKTTLLTLAAAILMLSACKKTRSLG